MLVTRTTVDSKSRPKPFAKYEPESRHAIRKVDVERDTTLVKLIELWNELEPYRLYYKNPPNEEFNEIKCGAKDIERFSLVLAEFQEQEGFDRFAGYFLSKLINNSPDREFVIHTCHLSIKINNIGLRNTKEITVNGDLGEYVGDEMPEEGVIIVKGNARSAGQKLNGGKIVIEGDVPEIAEEAENGEIHVNGEIGVVCLGAPSNLTCVKIFHKGKQIWPSDNQ